MALLDREQRRCATAPLAAAERLTDCADQKPSTYNTTNDITKGGRRHWLYRRHPLELLLLFAAAAAAGAVTAVAVGLWPSDDKLHWISSPSKAHCKRWSGNRELNTASCCKVMM